jgi:hypothetical protein
MAYLYRHIRIDKNEPFYIGVGTNKKYKREAQIGTRRSEYWNRIANKTKYEVEILMDDLTLEEANKKEIEFIALYGREDLGLGPLCNLTDGGGGQSNFIISDETRKKISEKKKGYKYSEEVKKKLSLSHIGNKHSEETKKKMSNTRKGKSFSDEHRNRINEKLTKKIALTNEFGDIIKSYNSVADASRDNNIRVSSICAVACGRRKTIYNKYFKYI